MNWYKKSQADIQTWQETGMNYGDIGHSTPSGEYEVDERFYKEKVKNYLWWWEKGLQVKPIPEEDERLSHYDFLGSDANQIYSGRVQEVPGEQTLISIMKPHRFENYKIPSHIIRSLLRKFGEDSKIVVF